MLILLTKTQWQKMLYVDFCIWPMWLVTQLSNAGWPSCDILCVWWHYFICGKESSAETQWKEALLIQTIQSFGIGHTWDYKGHKPKETSGSTVTNSWWKWKSVCRSPPVMTKAASIVSAEIMLPCWNKNWLDNQKLENYGGWELPQVTQAN